MNPLEPIRRATYEAVFTGFDEVSISEEIGESHCFIGGFVKTLVSLYRDSTRILHMLFTFAL